MIEVSCTSYTGSVQTVISGGICGATYGIKLSLGTLSLEVLHKLADFIASEVVNVRCRI